MKTMNHMNVAKPHPATRVRQARLKDVAGILSLKKRITGISLPWGEEQLISQIASFPEGQLVVETPFDHRIIAALGTLVIFRFDYSLFAKWCDLTANGTFKNQDREHGKTLFRSHLIVDPRFDGNSLIRNILCQAELQIAVKLGMDRIRTGIRLKDYYLFQHLAPAEYLRLVERGIIGDSWIRQTLERGFKPLALVCRYYPQDWRSDGNAVIAQLDLHVPEVKVELGSHHRNLPPPRSFALVPGLFAA